MLKVAAVITTALHPVSDPLKQPPPQVFSCAQVRRAVKIYGEDLVIAEARNRGLAEHVIQFLKKKCMEGG